MDSKEKRTKKIKRGGSNKREREISEREEK